MFAALIWKNPSFLTAVEGKGVVTDGLSIISSNNVLRVDDVIVSGRGHKLIDVSSSSVFGGYNDVSGSSMNGLITGKYNRDFNGKENLIAGEANSVRNSSSSLIQGVSHVVLDGSNNVSFGENNQLTRNKGSMSFGRKNILTDVTNPTIKLYSENYIFFIKPVY